MISITKKYKILPKQDICGNQIKKENCLYAGCSMKQKWNGGNEETNDKKKRQIIQKQSDKKVQDFFNCTYRDEKFQRRDRGSTFQNLVN